MVAARIPPVLSATAALSTFNLLTGLFVSSLWLSGAGAVGGAYLLLRIAAMRRRKDGDTPEEEDQQPAVRPMAVADRAVDPNDTDALVAQFLAQGRFPLLLRKQVAGNLTPGQLEKAVEALHETMALIPEGEVTVGPEWRDEEGETGEGEPAVPPRVVRVQQLFLDRYPVTNRQYFEFVAAGGYEQMPLWDPAIWPAVLDFVDATGEPGPRFWKCGCYLRGQENLPVVGISWYEAAAYARWLGKRLPTDAEWIKAGSWPVAVSATSRHQRKYPWGDVMDRSRANLWGSGPEKTVAVDEFPTGVSVGGVYQLIGNVWEWTASSFRGIDCHGDPLLLPTPMKSIRGGAFDTYFDNQATCQFQSGETLLARKHNVGMRCAVGACDLVLARLVETGENDRSASHEDGSAAGAPPAEEVQT